MNIHLIELGAIVHSFRFFYLSFVVFFYFECQHTNHHSMCSALNVSERIIKSEIKTKCTNARRIASAKCIFCKVHCISLNMLKRMKSIFKILL